MATIVNMLAQAIIVPIKNNQEISILPGLNIEVAQTVIEQLKLHPDLKFYIDNESVILREDNINEEEIHEEQTPVVDIDDEKVPVSKPDTDGNQIPITNKFYKFTSEDLKKHRISETLASTIIKLSPVEGWKNLEQMVTLLQLDAKTKDKVKSLFN